MNKTDQPINIAIHFIQKKRKKKLEKKSIVIKQKLWCESAVLFFRWYETYFEKRRQFLLIKQLVKKFAAINLPKDSMRSEHTLCVLPTKLIVSRNCMNTT